MTSAHSILAKGGWVQSYPFPYLVIENALPDSLYDALLKSRLPPDEIIGNRVTQDNQRVDLPAIALLQS